MTAPRPQGPATDDGAGTSRVQPARQPAWGLGEVVAGLAGSQVFSAFVTVAAMGVAGWKVSEDIPLWAVALLSVPTWLVYLGVVLYAGRTKGNGVVADFGLRFRPVDVSGLAIGVAVQLVVVPLLYLPLSWFVDIADDLEKPARSLSDKADGSLGWILLVLFVVIGAPIVEEIFYRGLLLQSLRKRGLHDGWAIVVSAAIFAAMHLQPLQFLGLFAIGLVLATITVRTGRLGMAIFTHMGFNAATVVVLYLSS